MMKGRFTLLAGLMLGAAFVCLSSTLISIEKDSRASAAPRTPNRRGESPRRPLRVGHPLFASPHFQPIAVSGRDIFVTNTPADTVDVIDARTRKIRARVHVGVDPVAVAVRPDGKEVWVSNHVSDSVSVIDNDPSHPTYLQVVATIQEFDPQTKATTFDEPIGIAFAGNEKVYVALSSENQIAVIDVATRRITKRLSIPAQDPRAIAVRGNRLYVIPFESNNKTQLSGGAKDDIDGDLVTFDAWEHSIRVNNVLSLGHVTDIVKRPDFPDRDLFVFDTQTDELVQTVDTLGTLLYGLTVDSQGRLFIAQTDARNDANGRAGTKKHGIRELENRPFLNRITQVSFGSTQTASTSADDASAKTDKPAVQVTFIDLEPLPPEHPAKGMALATPYAVQVTPDDSTLVGVAAGSDKLFTVDANSGELLGRIAVGTAPRGVALEVGEEGQPARAWVYNAVANTVSVVDITDPAAPQVAGFVKLEDPTPRQVKLGRTWFHDADASTTGTFSCESCHPDNNTDELLWVLNPPIVTGGNQIMPRSTMPVRGLRDTAPFHWDGTLGDPYGGINSASIRTPVEPTADPSDQTTSTRHLIDATLKDVMRAHWDETINDEGKPGALMAAERDDLAVYLLSVPYPPAQRRPYDNSLTQTARKGFKLFHVDGDLDPARRRPNVCGNCHRMPFWVSTNTPGTGMDAPTWRGAYDRFLILPQGRLNILEFPFFRAVAERGLPEEEIWRFSWGSRPRFNPVWRMVLEGSTGFPGAFARQVTLDRESIKDSLTADLLQALEVAAAEGAVVLEAEGVLIDNDQVRPAELQFDPQYRGGTYVSKQRDRTAFTRQELFTMAAQGRFVGTFTGRLGEAAGAEAAQPALWTLGPIHEQRGRQRFPILYEGRQTLVLSGRHFDEFAGVYVDGRRVDAVITVTGDEQEKVLIDLSTLPEEGMHTLQVQAEHGLFSNDFIFFVATDAQAAADLRWRIDEPHVAPRHPLARAVARGDLNEVKERLGDGSSINDRIGENGSTLLSTAALYGRTAVAAYLLERGADVDATNSDGNTPLHVAAFLCRADIVELLLGKGASVTRKNNRGETPVDVVSGEWTDGLAGFYRFIAEATGIDLDLERIRRARPQMATLLRERSKNAD